MLTLGIAEEEQLSMFKTISGILHFGNIEVKQRPREEWATIPNTTGTYVCTQEGVGSMMYSVGTIVNVVGCLLSKYSVADPQTLSHRGREGGPPGEHTGPRPDKGTHQTEDQSR